MPEEVMHGDGEGRVQRDVIVMLQLSASVEDYG